MRSRVYSAEGGGIYKAIANQISFRGSPGLLNDVMGLVVISARPDIRIGDVRVVIVPGGI